MARKWLQMITDERTKDFTTEHEGLYIQTIEKTTPNGETDSIEIKGVDGVRPTSSSYKPFELVIDMTFRGKDKQDTDLYTGTTASHLWFLHLDCSHKWTYDETEAQRAYVFCQECKLISSEDKIQMKDSGTGLRWQNRRTGAQLLS